MQIVCVGCGRSPADIPEYVDAAAEEGMTPEDFVRTGEGTFNPANGHFYCTEDYIKAGLPLGVAP